MGKRLFDLVASTLGLLVLSLPMLLVAMAIRLDSPGPVLFRQTRVGKGGVPFSILKFRTMRHTPAGAALRGSGEAVPTPSIIVPLTLHNDDRITRMGRFLRHRRIDELPQLINVLRGDMSLVGPRPEVPRYVALYPASVKSQVLSVRPGITDPAALAFRGEGALLAAADNPERCYVDDILPRKLALQVHYAACATFWTDVGVLWRTVQVLWEPVRASERPGA